MRPILVGLLCVFFLGTIGTYARIADWLTPPPPKYQFQFASGDYSVHVTTSFDLTLSDEKNLLVRLNGNDFFSTNDGIDAGVMLPFHNLPIRVGDNYLFVEVSAPSKSPQQKLDNAATFLMGGEEKGAKNIEFQFVRVQLFRDGIPIVNGDVTTHLDSKDAAIVEIFFSAFESTRKADDH